VIDDCSMRLSWRGGDAGGVAGSPPGEHTGMCLFGIAAGVPRDEVFNDRCGGGVGERPGIEGYLATAAAMLTIPMSSVVNVGEGTQRGYMHLCGRRGQLARSSTIAIGWIMRIDPSQSRGSGGGVKGTTNAR
jgi:hypothetical protein